ncbi:MAG: hypothetical protein KKF67_02745 [Nanoarchaeota archaeon]|nr:hypothetical protein [Nanoarchaeota archaeon]
MPAQDSVEWVPYHFSGEGNDFFKGYVHDPVNEKFVLEIDFYREGERDSLYILGTRISATDGKISEIRCNDVGPPSFKERFERLPEKVRHIVLNRLDNPAKGLLVDSLR